MFKFAATGGWRLSMTIVSRDFGEINITESDVITFPSGIFAFEDARRFIVISPLGENVFPMWLQCIDNVELCFIVFNPYQFYENYSIKIENSDKQIIELSDKETAEYLVVAVIPQNYKNATVNLKSPIIINSKKKLAVQVIAYENYPLKHPVFHKEESSHAGSN